ncbi:unnamed protein product, partial [Mesorhabditis spiculigera]
MSNNNEDESLRKLFIGGIKLDTTDETFHDYYAKFGEVVDSVIMKDAHTQRSRGFGFVTYASKEAVDAAMSMRPHVIDDKPVDVKRAIPKDAINKNESNISSKRLYVSGIKEATRNRAQYSRLQSCTKPMQSTPVFLEVVSLPLLTEQRNSGFR